MTSKIVNMAEKVKDAEDRMLESLFASDSIADDGFSAQIVHRINRRLWLRRLTLPTAVLIGGTISFKPLAGLAAMLGNFVGAVQIDFLGPVTAALPQIQMLVMGGVLLGIGLLSMRILQD